MPLLSTEELTPPEAVQREALKGVALHEAGRSGDGIKPETIRRANSIANGEPQSEQWVTSEAPAWFARHESDWEEGVDDVPGQESPGYVAWLLWGGDAGSEWVEEMQQLYLVRRAKEQGGPVTGASAMAIDPAHMQALVKGAPKLPVPGALNVVHVEGPLYPMDYLSARLEMKRAQLQGEKVVVLHVDSPGGYVSGVRETRRAIARAQEAGIYVVAYVSGMAASAALWLASAADEVVLSPLAQAGSVGVVVTLARDSEDGDTIEVVSSQTPRKRGSTNDSEYMSALQGRVDKLATVMLGEIAADRGVAVDQLGDGSVYGAEDAVARGLADRIAVEADDWMFLGGNMPLDYQRRVRSATAPASTNGGAEEALDMSEQNKTAEAVDNAALAQVEQLQAELAAAREQLQAIQDAAHKAQDELLRRDAVAMVETHVVGGRIPQAKRGEWVERAMRMGIDEVAGMLADLSPIVAVAAPVGHGGAAADAVSDDPRSAEVRRANDMLARFRAGRGV
jgi:ClpP class serine protease